MSAAKSQPPAAGEAADMPIDLLERLAKSDTDARSAEHAANMLVRFSEEARMIIRLSSKMDPVSIAGLRKKYGDAYLIRACNSHAALVAALVDSSHSLAIQRDGANQRGDARAARLLGEQIESNSAAINSAKAVQS